MNAIQRKYALERRNYNRVQLELQELRLYPAYIHLDDLVLQNCLAQVGCIKRIGYELVSCRLARNIRRTYNRYISLTIVGTEPKRPIVGAEPHNPFMLYITDQFGVGNPFDSIGVDKLLLANVLAQILFRYKRIRCLRIEESCEPFAAHAILACTLIDKCKVTAVKQLQLNKNNLFSRGSERWGKDFHTTPTMVQSVLYGFDICLIDTFSSFLKKLTLSMPMPNEKILSQTLWTSVTNCDQLKTLRLGLDCRPNRFMFTHLLDCLKSRKIKNFESDLRFRSQWLSDAFQANENFRKLFIRPADLTSVLCSSEMISIIRNLRVLGLNFDSDSYGPEFQESELVEILNTLPKNGYLAVTQTFHRNFSHPDHFDNNSEAAFTELQRGNSYLTQQPQGVEIIARSLLWSLNFWLKLSETTARPIQVHANVVHLKETKFQLLRLVSANEDFANLSITQIARNGIITFQHQQAQIQLRFGQLCGL